MTNPDTARPASDAPAPPRHPICQCGHDAIAHLDFVATANCLDCDCPAFVLTASPAQEAQSPHRCADPLRCPLCSPTASASFRSPAQEATPASNSCEACAGAGCLECGGTGRWYHRTPGSRHRPAQEATPPREEFDDAPDWMCRHQRSHGPCNTMNGAESSSCGACGEDRPAPAAPAPSPTCAYVNGTPICLRAARAFAAPTPPRCAFRFSWGTTCGQPQDHNVHRLPPEHPYCHTFAAALVAPEATGAPEPLHDMTDDQADAIVAEEVERAIAANRQIGHRGVTLLRTVLRYIEKRVGPREAYSIADATFQLRRANTRLEDEATDLRATVAALTADRDHWKALSNAIAGQHDRAMDGLSAERGARAP